MNNRLLVLTLTAMNIQPCYISTGRLKDAPQVRMNTTTEPFLTVESAIKWAEPILFSFIIREWSYSGKQSSVNKVLYDSDK
jgi:hypothetical protein